MFCMIIVDLLQLKESFRHAATLNIKTAFHKECFATTQS